MIARAIAGFLSIVPVVGTAWAAAPQDGIVSGLVGSTEPIGVCDLVGVLSPYCQSTAVVARTQILFRFHNTDAMTAFSHSIAQREGTPCHDGLYTVNPRRRAPPLHMIAWSSATSNVVLTRDSSLPNAISLTVLQKHLRPTGQGEQEKYRELLRAFDELLPPACVSIR